MKSAEFVHDSDMSDDDTQVIKNLDYKPPQDFTAHKAKQDAVSVFDADEVATHEMWLIRVPEGVTNEDLATMSITTPPSSSSEATVLGSFKKKETLGSSSTTTKYQLQTIGKDDALNSEMKTLKALVPDSQRGGKLVQAPVEFKQYMAVVAHTSVPSGSALAQEILERPIPERAQPQGLKARFKFAGVDTQEPGKELNGSGKEFVRKWKEEEARRQKEREADEQRLEAARRFAEQQEAVAEAEAEAEAETAAEDKVAKEDEPSTTMEVDQAEEKGEEEAAAKDNKASKKRKTDESVESKPKKVKTIEEADADSKKEKKDKKDKKEKKDKKDKKEKKDKSA